ncbi:hypothetical protein CYMTET_13076, partial [Cymbomonas tetramitiformis]
TGLPAYAFAEEAENSVLAARFQHAIDNGDPVEFDALCMLAGGKPEVFTDLSACSFCEEDGEVLVSAVAEFSEMAHAAGASTFNINTFTADLPPAAGMNLLSAVETPERVKDYKPATYAASDDDDEDASVAPPRPRYGCGNAIPGFGSRSLLTSSLVCALFVICATAAPQAVADVGGAGARTCTDPPVGGATWTASAVPATEASPAEVVRDVPCAIPPRLHRREQRRQGFYMTPVPWHPGPPPPAVLFEDGPPLSPASSSDDEAPPSGSVWQHPGAVQPPVIEDDSTISSTNDLPPAPEAGNYFTLTASRCSEPDRQLRRPLVAEIGHTVPA